MTARLADLAGSYAGIICDVWGVIHNGVEAWPGAVEALVRFREQGGCVILVTNAPRRASYVIDQLLALGVPANAFDDVVTSGDVARDVLAERGAIKVLHVGTDVHLPLYDGLPIELTDADKCDLVSCTALENDEVETPDDYEDRLRAWQARGVPMLCVNPDIVVDRGGRLIWCAGSLAKRYEELGGRAEIVGKPYAPVYQRAFDRMADIRGRRLERGEILAVGDGLNTDLRGAAREGIDALFVTSGIHAAEFGPPDQPDPAAVERFLTEAGVAARAFSPDLVW